MEMLDGTTITFKAYVGDDTRKVCGCVLVRAFRRMLEQSTCL
jgi:hypothetical protein